MVIASDPRCHLGLCLDSALHNHVLYGKRTPHTPTRAGAGVFSCWFPWSRAPLLSPCCLLEGPCDPLPRLYLAHCCVYPCVLDLFLFPGDSFLLNPAYPRTVFPTFPEWGLALFWRDISFCPPPQYTHIPCHHIGCLLG